MPEAEIARITASQPRRVFGVTSMAVLGAMLIYVALMSPPSQFVWQIFLLALGAAALLGARGMWRATSVAIVLTDEALREDGGEVLATLDNIEKVERGMFAMKPSNGFNIVLKDARPGAWRPGLWWRVGRRVAIGGVTAGSQTKPVADMLIAKLAMRDGV